MFKPAYNLTSQDGPDVTDPREIDWVTRRQLAQIGFSVDGEGLPVNPVEPNLPTGRNGLWHWGEAVAVDAIVFAEVANRNYVLMIERGDGHGWALPGGMIDPGESAQTAVARELREETGLYLAATGFEMGMGQYVPDPRAGRNAWVVTIPGVAHFTAPQLPKVAGHDDARRAEWLPADTYTSLETAITGHGGTVFAAHTDMLHALLG